jgi:hypothetical protein
LPQGQGKVPGASLLADAISSNTDNLRVARCLVN